MKRRQKKTKSKRPAIDGNAQGPNAPDFSILAGERISRLLTVDSILTLAQRLHRIPEYGELDLKQLYEVSKVLLNNCAKRIETEGLSVSLGTIVQNLIFFFDHRQEYSIDLLIATADDLIGAASQIESFIAGERSSQPARLELLGKVETALQDRQIVAWFAGAKQIAGVKNPTDASDQLKESFAWFLKLFGKISPSEYPLLSQFLEKAISDKKPDIPEAFAAVFKANYYPTFMVAKKLS